MRTLDELAVTHGNVSESPAWYMPPLVGIWSVEDAELAGVTGWWAMAGELPTIIRSTDELPDERTFMAAVSRFFLDSATALERDDPPSELVHIPVSERPRAARVLRHRAEILDECVE